MRIDFKTHGLTVEGRQDGVLTTLTYRSFDIVIAEFVFYPQDPSTPGGVFALSLADYNNYSPTTTAHQRLLESLYPGLYVLPAKRAKE